uniref:Gustatory receptor n=1 Tax=Anopheles stephensi TaxID=30069 RepID=A0A182YN97_ANOST
MSPLLKYWFNIGSFFETMQPNIRVLKLLGLFPFTVSRATRGDSSGSSSHTTSSECNRFKTLKSEVKFMDVVIFTLWQTFFLQMLYASWPKVFSEMPVSRIMALVTVLLYFVGGVNCSVSATLVLILRKKFIRMVQLVEEADHLFYRFCAEIQHAKIHLVSVALLCGSFFCHGLLFVNDVVVGYLLRNTTRIAHDMPLQTAFSYYYIVRTIHITCVIAFIGGLYGFRERLLTLNKQLRFHLLEMPSTDRMASFGDMMHRVQGFIVIYGNLCDAIRLFSTIFVWQPLFFCASLIVAAVFATLSIGHILTNSAPVVLAMAMIYTTITVLYTSIFVLLVKLGNDMKKEGKQTAILVHKAINQSSKTPALVERIISAIATYSVILIQFELGVPRFFISGILQHQTEILADDP